MSLCRNGSHIRSRPQNPSPYRKVSGGGCASDGAGFPIKRKNRKGHAQVCFQSMSKSTVIYHDELVYRNSS